MAVELTLLAPGEAALGRQDKTVPVRAQDLADQAFIVAQTVDGGRIEKGAASVQCAQQHRLRLVPGWRGTIGMGQAHAAQADL